MDDILLDNFIFMYLAVYGILLKENSFRLISPDCL